MPDEPQAIDARKLSESELDEIAGGTGIGDSAEGLAKAQAEQSLQDQMAKGNNGGGSGQFAERLQKSKGGGF